MTLTLLKYKAEFPPLGFSEYIQLCCTYHLSGNKNKNIVMEHCSRITVSFDGWWLPGPGLYFSMQSAARKDDNISLWIPLSTLFT